MVICVLQEWVRWNILNQHFRILTQTVFPTQETDSTGATALHTTKHSERWNTPWEPPELRWASWKTSPKATSLSHISMGPFWRLPWSWAISYLTSEAEKKIWSVQSSGEQSRDKSKIKYTVVTAQDNRDCHVFTGGWLQCTCSRELVCIPWRSTWCSAGTVTEKPSTHLLQTRAPASWLTVSLPAPSQHRLPRTKLMTGERGKIKFAKVLNI